MPYRSNEDLPASITSHLPPHAQDIFRAAFNAAFNAHESDPEREAIAFRIAWAAVKHGYEKRPDGRWIPRLRNGPPSDA